MALVYDLFLTLILCASAYLTARQLSLFFGMENEDASDLRDICARYVIEERNISNIVDYAAGTALVVSRAELNGQKVVLKRWQGARVHGDERRLFAQRLIRDLDRWRSLSHRNISPFVGVVLHTWSLPGFVVPYYQTVASYLKQNPKADVVHLLGDVAEGLTYLHAQDPPIAHGDIRGSTVFVTPAGAACLSDIGIVAIPQPNAWTHTGLSGTRWFAPELMDMRLRPTKDSEPTKHPLLRSSLPVTPESDVYAFGMLSYEMHTRSRPFGGLRDRMSRYAQPPAPAHYALRFPCSRTTACGC
ncbi:kinase-like domain-containing protein [Mycena sp. CBHHK59/15]|nr:kinase-like domain-containing protein [Mycena sp. CBHHK59/15]